MIPQRALTGSTKHIFYAFAIVVLVAAAYSGTLHSPFTFDDADYISENSFIKDTGQIWHPWSLEGATLSRNVIYSRYTRYVGYLSLHMNYMLGGLDPSGYHAFNIMVHAACGVLVYFIALMLMQSPALASLVQPERRLPLALASALLFSLHPVQTQAVTYISQRFASLAAMFCLASVLSYLLYRMKGRTLYLALSVCASVLAMHTKENAFLMPLGIALLEFALFESPQRQRIRALAPLLLTMLIVPLYKIAGASGAIGEATSTFNSMGRTEYLLTSIPVIATYLRLILLPVNLNLDYDYPVYRSLADLHLAGALALHLALLGIALYLFRKNPAARLASVAILWFYLMISVENSIIPLADVIFEHRIYLPAVFILIALPIVAASTTGRPYIVASALVMLSLALGAAAYARNAVWSDNITLWSDVVLKSPDKARGHNNLGLAYKEAGDLDKALMYFRRTLELEPDMTATRLNLGLIYDMSGKYEEALDEYAKVADKWPTSYEVYNNMGLVYRKLGLYSKAVEAYGKSISLRPDFDAGYYNMGNAYMYLGMHSEAEASYLRAIALNPNDERYAQNLDVARRKLSGR